MLSVHEAKRPFVVAIDLGTSSARCALYDANADLVEGFYAQIRYQMTTTPEGGVEIDASELLELIYRVIDELLLTCGQSDIDLNGQIAAVGTCTFWHSLLAIDKNGQAITPLFNWSDTRSRDFAEKLEADPGRTWLHTRTGCMPHSSYYPAKIMWLRATNPELASRVSKWISISEYLFSQLFECDLVSSSMASGTGLFSPQLKDWNPEVLRVLGVELTSLSRVTREDEFVKGLRPEFASRWPILSNIPWTLPIGDGAASNIGSGCVTSDKVAINIGTSGAMRVCYKASTIRVPEGLWVYVADNSYVVTGGALSNAGDVYAWGRDTLRLEKDEVDPDLEKLEPDSHGLTVLPFFSGERSTGWADHARAAITGMNLNTTPLEILQAMLEAVAFRFAAIFELLKPELDPGARIIASGGAIQKSTYLPQLLSDVIGVPVIVSLTPEASSRGAAIVALKVSNLIASLDAVPERLGKIHEPNIERHKHYTKARARQEVLYKLLVQRGLGESLR